MTLEKNWQRNYSHVQEIIRRRWKPESERIFVAFNANIDTVHKLSEKNLEKIIAKSGGKKIFAGAKNPPQKIETEEDFLENLVYAISTSGAREIVCKNPEVAEWADRNFPPREERVGGQAGIMANFLSGLGVDVVMYTPLLSEKQASLLDSRVKCPSLKNGKLHIAPAKKAVNSEMTKINRIFEFAKGFKAGKISSARANRFILASRPKGTEPLFPDALIPHFPEIFKGTARAILSGYQSEKVGHKEHFKKAEEEIKKMRTSNPKMLIHLEEAFVSSMGLEREIIDFVAKNVHSIGMNEVEAHQVAECVLGHSAAGAGNTLEELYLAGRGIAKRLGLLRVHIHYIGFYLAVVDKRYPVQPERVRDALLFASLAAEARAEIGTLPSKEEICSEKIHGISETGMKEILALKEDMRLCPGFVETGICDMGDHFLVAVPTLLSGKPKTTVGLGDVISSAAFASEIL